MRRRLGMIYGSFSVKVEASADTLWETLVDYKGAPSFMHSLVSIEVVEHPAIKSKIGNKGATFSQEMNNLLEGNEVQVGTVFKWVGMFKRREHGIFDTITAFNSSEYPRRVAAGCTFRFDFSIGFRVV